MSPSAAPQVDQGLQWSIMMGDQGRSIPTSSMTTMEIQVQEQDKNRKIQNLLLLLGF